MRGHVHARALLRIEVKRDELRESLEATHGAVAARIQPLRATAARIAVGHAMGGGRKAGTAVQYSRTATVRRTEGMRRAAPRRKGSHRFRRERCLESLRAIRRRDDKVIPEKR